MITLPEVQLLLGEKGIRVSIPTLRRWARAGVFGGMLGKRDRRYIMREREVRSVLHGIRPSDWKRNRLTVRYSAPRN